MNVRDFPVPRRHRRARIGLRDQSFQEGKSHEHSFYGWNRLGKKRFFGAWHRRQGSDHSAARVSRAKLAELVAQLPPCLIGMEACSGGHEWARRFSAFGHTVRLMAPKFVMPYRKSGKNDGNDAEAICEAVGRPNMRFVPIKSIEQQSDLSLHRVRQGFIEERTATLNRLRGLLAEFGHVLPLRAVEVRRRVPELLGTLPTRIAVCLRDLLEHAARLEAKALEYEREIKAHC